MEIFIHLDEKVFKTLMLSVTYKRNRLPFLSFFIWMILFRYVLNIKMSKTSSPSQIHADAIFSILRNGEDDHLNTIFEKLEKKWELGDSEGFFDFEDNENYKFSMELSYDFKNVIQDYLETSNLRHYFHQMDADWKIFLTITLFDDWMFRTKVRPK